MGLKIYVIKLYDRVVFLVDEDILRFFFLIIS